MKVGDLVKQVGLDGTGVIVGTVSCNGFIVLFSDGRYDIEGCHLEVISENR